VFELNFNFFLHSERKKLFSIRSYVLPNNILKKVEEICIKSLRGRFKCKNIYVNYKILDQNLVFQHH
jgi:hypothetical protein